MVAGRSAPAPGCRHRFPRHFPRTWRIRDTAKAGFHSAVNGVADIARQGRAAALALIGAAHAAQERGQRFGQRGGHQAARIVGFRPVERDSKIRTTGTARHARVDFTHNYT